MTGTAGANSCAPPGRPNAPRARRPGKRVGTSLSSQLSSLLPRAHVGGAALRCAWQGPRWLVLCVGWGEMGWVGCGLGCLRVPALSSVPPRQGPGDYDLPGGHLRDRPTTPPPAPLPGAPGGSPLPPLVSRAEWGEEWKHRWREGEGGLEADRDGALEATQRLGDVSGASRKEGDGNGTVGDRGVGCTSRRGSNRGGDGWKRRKWAMGRGSTSRLVPCRRVRPPVLGSAGPSTNARLSPPGAPAPTCSALRPEPGSSSGRSERSPAPHPPAAPSPPQAFATVAAAAALERTKWNRK